MTPSDHLRDWFNEPVSTPTGTWLRRDKLSLRAMCEQIEYDQSNFRKYLDGKFNLPPTPLLNMITVAEAYGYVPITSEHHFL